VAYSELLRIEFIPFTGPANGTMLKNHFDE
jgi:hypothetical protein